MKQYPYDLQKLTMRTNLTYVAGNPGSDTTILPSARIEGFPKTTALRCRRFSELSRSVLKDLQACWYGTYECVKDEHATSRAESRKAFGIKITLCSRIGAVLS